MTTPESTSPQIPLPQPYKSWETLRHAGLKSARMHTLQRVYGITVPPKDASATSEKVAEPKDDKGKIETDAEKKEKGEKGGGDKEKAKKTA